VDVQSFVRGFLVGAAAVGAIGGGLWAYNWLNKQH
jgi:hypothetical protein